MEHLMQDVAQATPDASNKHALAATASHARAAAVDLRRTPMWVEVEDATVRHDVYECPASAKEDTP